MKFNYSYPHRKLPEVGPSNFINFVLFFRIEENSARTIGRKIVPQSARTWEIVADYSAPVPRVAASRARSATHTKCRPSNSAGNSSVAILWADDNFGPRPFSLRRRQVRPGASLTRSRSASQSSSFLCVIIAAEPSRGCESVLTQTKYTPNTKLSRFDERWLLRFFSLGRPNQVFFSIKHIIKVI